MSKYSIPYMQEHYGSISEEEMWYHFSFFKAGFISVLSEWIHRGCLETPEKLAEIILRNLPL
ncbi:MAG: TetR family transcriptional regulator C-terminal domain-containing protein [Lachnospiraceae bacterium]|nr:TetR family transcriptional regulator C-terminal domain-containing protein [Lachnospiraceae bacterium]